ncbi:MAG: hypothetical protein KGJ02_01265 [Verrucomicrobiota bacterium]|nr:hypothetical protein [Verrucomicrobiota bacterium]
MKDTEHILRNFKLIGESPHELPEAGHLFINVPEDERENCIITYASFNERYPRGLRRLVKIIGASDFRGHLYYRLGGWPNCATGDLSLAYVPFAFKVCFFREMQKLGYKRVLWLDSSILPFANLNSIFERIQRDGFFVQANSHSIGPYMNEETAAAFGFSLQETFSIPSCSAAIIGIDFTHEKAASLIEEWYLAAKHPDAFYSPRSDQTAFSLLLYRKELSSLMTPLKTLGDPNNVCKETLFLMDRKYVKTQK